MSMDFTACAEQNRKRWQQARGRYLAQMETHELVASLDNHPNTRKALQRLNADIAKLPPVVDKFYLVEQEQAEFDKHNEGDRFE